MTVKSGINAKISRNIATTEIAASIAFPVKRSAISRNHQAI